MEGIINLNKPAGITSAKALYKLRSITQVRKSGHAGTLDPNATGVLIICLGRATKLVERLMDQPKVYRATAKLDLASESHDTDNPTTQVEVDQVPTIDTIREALRAFEGWTMQVPPRVSAIKLRGVPAYKRASKGEAFELAARPAMIYWMHVHAYEWPDLDFEMCCGRGTYVRSVIRDLGSRLGTGGCLSSLVRTRIGPFDLAASWTIAEIREAAGHPYLIELDRAKGMLPDTPSQIPDRPGLDRHGSDRPTTPADCVDRRST